MGHILYLMSVIKGGFIRESSLNESDIAHRKVNKEMKATEENGICNCFGGIVNVLTKKKQEKGSLDGVGPYHKEAGPRNNCAKRYKIIHLHRKLNRTRSRRGGCCRFMVLAGGGNRRTERNRPTLADHYSATWRRQKSKPGRSGDTWETYPCVIQVRTVIDVGKISHRGILLCICLSIVKTRQDKSTWNR